MLWGLAGPLDISNFVFFISLDFFILLFNFFSYGKEKIN